MNNAWLLRPYPNNLPQLNLFKQQNFIAIGWPCIGDLSGKSKEELKKIMSLPPYSYTSLKLGNAYAIIDIFVNQMNIGDYVLIPDGEDIYFAVIESKYYFDSDFDDSQIGCSHQRKIQWKNHIYRNELPIELRNALRNRRTVGNLSPFYSIIAALANGEPIQDKKQSPFVDVSYPLRPDLSLSFQIPRDITNTEATRLADFIRTLYFK